MVAEYQYRTAAGRVLWQHSRRNGAAEASIAAASGIAEGLTFIKAEEGSSQ
jgi:hypothetical protein